MLYSMNQFLNFVVSNYVKLVHYRNSMIFTGKKEIFRIGNST